MRSVSKKSFPEEIPVEAGRVEHYQIARMICEARAILSVSPDVSSFEQIGEECHYRFDAADDQIIGHGEVCALSDGFFIQVVNGQLPRPRLFSVITPDAMRIRIASEGTETYAPAGERAVTVEGPSAMIVIEPAGQPPARVALDGRHHMAYLWIDRHALARFCEGREQELPAVLQAFLRGALQRTVVRRMSMKSELLRCLEDLQRCELDGWTRTLFMHSKATEIFCHVLKMLEFDEGFGAPEASLVTARGVLKAQQILSERFASPPSLETLARDVGVSRSSLCAGFRQIVGQSVFGYIQDRRMDRALTLLTESQEPVSEIARAVGYSHLSSFSAAVQRRFGMSPSELRRSAS